MNDSSSQLGGGERHCEQPATPVKPGQLGPTLDALTLALVTLAGSLIPGARSLMVVSDHQSATVVLNWRNIWYTTGTADSHALSRALALLAEDWAERTGRRYLALTQLDTGSQVKSAMSDLLAALSWNAALAFPDEGLAQLRVRVSAAYHDLTTPAMRATWSDEGTRSLICQAIEDVRLRNKPTPTLRPISTWRPEVMHLD